MVDSLAASGQTGSSSETKRMATSGHDLDPQHRKLKLLAAGAEAELQLLRTERKAEKRLAEATASLASDEARMQRAQQRLERSRAAVETAQELLREVQERRAAGPTRDQD